MHTTSDHLGDLSLVYRLDASDQPFINAADFDEFHVESSQMRMLARVIALDIFSQMQPDDNVSDDDS